MPKQIRSSPSLTDIKFSCGLLGQAESSDCCKRLHLRGIAESKVFFPIEESRDFPESVSLIRLVSHQEYELHIRNFIGGVALKTTRQGKYGVGGVSMYDRNRSGYFMLLAMMAVVTIAAYAQTGQPTEVRVSPSAMKEVPYGETCTALPDIVAEGKAFFKGMGGATSVTGSAV
ncbi:hypothetical protein AYO43_07900 [Nitrospira sp. SCGC AG-212-E16]|nr:hypothetical protein AYO43_07900 [Nitrospira sp. SCGC AG-212-E16]